MYVADAAQIVPRIVALADLWTRSDQPVVFTRYVADQKMRDLLPNDSWIHLLDSPVNACVPGHIRLYADGSHREGVAIIDALTGLKAVKVVDKILYDAFSAGDLEIFLHKHSIDTLFIAGVVTDVCVADTARTAVHRGFKTHLIADACASDQVVRHQIELDNFGKNYGYVVSTASLLG